VFHSFGPLRLHKVKLQLPFLLPSPTGTSISYYFF
jgi:hypothetical protein